MPVISGNPGISCSNPYNQDDSFEVSPVPPGYEQRSSRWIDGVRYATLFPEKTDSNLPALLFRERSVDAPVDLGDL